MLVDADVSEKHTVSTFQPWKMETMVLRIVGLDHHINTAPKL
jgi:hypothetical protein